MRVILFTSFVCLLTSACGKDIISVENSTLKNSVIEILSVYRDVAARNGYDKVYNDIDLTVKFVPGTFNCDLEQGRSICYGLTLSEIGHFNNRHTMTLALIDVFNGYNSNFSRLENPETDLWKSGIVHEMTHVFFFDDYNHTKPELWCEKNCSGPSLFEDVITELQEMHITH
jgi:hypothetical protein